MNQSKIIDLNSDQALRLALLQLCPPDVPNANKLRISKHIDIIDDLFNYVKDGLKYKETPNA